jgi:hypothetical protein
MISWYFMVYICILQCIRKSCTSIPYFICNDSYHESPENTQNWFITSLHDGCLLQPGLCPANSNYIYSISDSTPVVQLGLGIRLLYKSGFFARLDANYNRFKTEFSLDGYTPQYLLLAGFIYNEKMIIRLLAGQNWQLFNRKGWSFDLYGYAGPSLAFEMGKNFSRTNYLERGGVLGTSAAALKVQPTPGFSFGLGTSIQWHEKVSLFLEISGNRPMYQVENVLTPEIAYRQFYLTLGLGYRIFRRATY